MGDEAKRGRPSSYTPEIGLAICEEISTTLDSLETICNRHDEFPETRAVYRWINNFEDFRQNYVRAKDEQKWLLAEKLMHVPSIALDDAKNEDPKRVNAIVNAHKMEADNIKWVLAHLDSKKWGRQPEQVSGDMNPQLKALADALNAGPVDKSKSEDKSDDDDKDKDKEKDK